MRRLSYILFCFILLGTLAFTQPINQSGGFKEGSEPDGFRGIKWGTPVSSVDGMAEIWADGDMKVYERVGDPLEIGSAKVHSVLYVFWQGKFMEARVVIPKYYGPDKTEMANFNEIKGICDERFGDREKPIFGKEEYSWRGERSWIWLGFENPGFFRLNVGSTELQQEKKLSEEQRAAREENLRIAKAKATTDF